MKIAVIMLAAGNSRRFGSNKLMYKVEGKPMYQRILEQLLEVQKKAASLCPYNSCSRKSYEEKTEAAFSVTVVTQYEEIEAAAQSLGMRVLRNPHPEEGISSSIKIGLGANQDADAFLFTVSDQPWLRAETILGLIECYMHSSKGIACVSHNGKTGNPCMFSSGYFSELLRLTGDVGGKRIISANPGDTAILEVPDGRELTDVDVRGHSI
ncbi:MAG: nucleotidyltransferase family protein [Eubacteriales bacterium]|nr:nucleotidyltransferase family protein [Eubacteriales bacterium]